MHWKELTLRIPVPRPKLSPRFSLRALLLILSAVAISCHFLFPPTYRASSVVTLPVAPTTRAGRVFTETQLALFQSPFVINSAIRNLNARQLESFHLHNNDASWIATNLDVALRPNKNLADVTLSSEDIPARELQLIVDGIIDAYEREIVLATLNPRTSE